MQRSLINKLRELITTGFIFATLLTGFTFGQSPGPEPYRSKFENDVVAVYEVRLSPGASASVFEAAHDTFWLALSDGSVKFVRNNWTKTDINFRIGDTRFFPSFETKAIENPGVEQFHGLLIVLKTRGLTTTGCECTGNTGKTICGCKGATHLESLWAFGLGQVTLAGTSLAGGEAYRSAAMRDDMLLLAVTDVDLEDQIPSGRDQLPETLRLKAGDAVWIASGRHQFKNVASSQARFVTAEF